MFPLSRSHLQRIFDKLDKNGDGKVSIDELMWLLQRIGNDTCREDELELLLGKTSLDFIDFLFFYDAIINIDENRCEDDQVSLIENDLYKAFAVFDSNGDGLISSEELQNALSRFGLWDDHCSSLDRKSKSIINMYDTNSDGFLDFEEFKNMMLFAKS
ncbi:probable calcium-binding protein CML44 [Olea europaea var. sylvestris]|uniref:Probable calcium-binding CML44 n=1 Tax=Olea europaea subsp. europaea TaxID=158383 RepID=A0A8S0PEW9_OLEEU|nr:probable calcium-binding protein CML44 [Olea europaea var. sylvestris]CAA2946086.1 probable calcium-binding CML44 [Olea europaea subsp. europaea]CAA2946089.1 probable calcium-binding CML44 [Olea europaea subsp. europaea]